MRTLNIYLLLTGLLVFGWAPLHADSLGEIRTRMIERVATLDNLKASGRVGENNRGYLAPRETLAKAEQEVVDAENKDRRTVYEHLARRASVSVEQVEKQRALDIAKSSAQGIWLQNEAGQWYRKS